METRYSVFIYENTSSKLIEPITRLKIEKAES
jgi:hypothetical protein